MDEAADVRCAGGAARPEQRRNAVRAGAGASRSSCARTALDGPLRLLTNNPAQREGLEAYGLTVLERVALHTDPTPENVHHLAAKQRRMGHLLDLERTAGSSTAMPAAVAAPARR